LKRLEEAKFAASKIPSPPKPIVRPTPVKGELVVPYRVIYTGSKFFWRSKHNIDFHIYHHTEPAGGGGSDVPFSILEIIGYDSATQTELPRLYLDEEIVSQAISPEEILSRVKIHKDSNTKYLSVLESIATPQHQGMKTMKSKLLKIPDDEPSGGGAGALKDEGGVGDEDNGPIATASMDDDQSLICRRHPSEERIERKNSSAEQELDALMYEEEKRLSIASRIMSKLQYQKVISLSPIPSARVTATTTNSRHSKIVPVTATTSPRLVQFDLCFLDPQLQSAVLSDKPTNLTSVTIPRRRHSTQAEITESFRSLNTMQMELHEMTDKAEKMSQLIRQSIEMFTHHHFSPPNSFKQAQYMSPRMKSSSSQLPIDKLTLEERKKREIRERWRYTIHKVVLRNALGHTIEFLQANVRGRTHAR
jgi:hypothetical protein